MKISSFLIIFIYYLDKVKAYLRSADSEYKKAEKMAWKTITKQFKRSKKK